MKKKTVKQLLALVLASMVTLTACGQASEQKGSEASTQSSSVEETKVSTEVSSEVTEEKEINKDELPVLTLYPRNANLLSGLVTGHRSDFFAENGFQMEVWAYSDEKTNAILASGDLPDLMYVKGSQLEIMIEAGMVLNLEEYLDQIPHLYTSEYAEGALDALRKKYSAGTGELYGLPMAVGESGSGWVDSTDRNTVKLRWDVYEQIGAPEINDYWELIDVMEQMLKAHPQEEDGTKCYGLFLDNGMDTTYFGGLYLWYRWHGYDEAAPQYMLEVDKVTGEISSILTKDSLYYEGLKWYNEVYRRGLMDPESINTDRGTQAKKVDAALAMVPGGTLPGWAPNYYEYYIPGSNIYYDNINETPTSNILVINAETEHLEECLAVLDLWCDPNAALRIQYGPEGDIWTTDGDNAYITEEFAAWTKAGNSVNGFKMSDGSEWATWNTGFLVNKGVPTTYGDGEGGYRTNDPTLWSEVQAIKADNENFAAWQKTTGYANWMEWLAAEGAYYSASPLDNVSSFMNTASDSQKLVISSLKDIVVPASWKMVYSETDEEFDKIWDQMVKDCMDLGAQDIIDWRIAEYENGIKLRDAK